MRTSEGKAGLVWLGFAMVLLLALRAPAQTLSGSISGTVVDQSDAVIPKVAVTLTNESTGETRKTVTSESGEFVFTAVPSGTYTVALEATGFKSLRRTGVNLSAVERLPLGTIRLSVGDVTQSVVVASQGETVSAESADIGGNITAHQLDELIVKGRNPMSLLRTIPGVSTGVFINGGDKNDLDPDGMQSNGGIYGTLTAPINGGRMFWNTITVDGQISSNPDWPGLFEAAVSVDAMSELKVTANNYTAEYGRNLGATVTLATRSGTKDFHGGANYFKRHEMFNANDFFNNRDGLPKPLFRYSNFGFSVGGPIYIPGKFNTSRDKLFFFYSQEEWRIKNPTSPIQRTVPTALERTGDFSQTIDQAGNLIPVIDPLTKQPFSGNVIPSSRINPNAQVLLNVFPLPNQLDRGVTSGAYNYQWQDLCIDPKRIQGLKTDYLPNSKDHFSLGLRRWWSDDRAYTNDCFVDGWNDIPLVKTHYDYSTDNALITWTRIISPTATNEFNIGTVGEKERQQIPGPFPDRAKTFFDAVNRQKLGYTLGQFYGEANPYNFIPQATFGGVPNAAGITHDGRQPGDQGYLIFNAGDHFSWVRGGHTFKFGLDWEWDLATDGLAATYGDGLFAFGRDPNNPGDAGWPYATALLGNFVSYQETNTRPRYRYERKNYQFFGQDTWKLSRKLTLTYGLRLAAFTNWNLTVGTGSAFVPSRYDPTKESPLFRPAFDANGNRVAQDPSTGQFFPAVYIGAFVPGVGEPFSGTVKSNDPSYARDYYDGRPVQVMPRFGFAYDVFGDGKTAVRGGFGITKETMPTYGGSSGRTIFNAPSQLNPQVFYGNMDTVFQSSSVLFPSSNGAFERNFKVPSMYNYSLSIQRDIGHQTVVDVAYVGNVARHLLQTVNLNTLPYGAHFLPENQDPTRGRALPDVFLRPYLGYQGITMREFNGYSNYNSLQATLNRRFAAGLQIGIAYTYSHSLATGSSEGGSVARYLSERFWNYGNTAFDQTHNLVVNYVYDIPKLSKLAPNPVVHHVFDNWTISGVNTYASGFPRGISFITTDGADIPGGGDGVRPLLIADPRIAHGDRTLERWFNTAAFARPPQGDHGNTPVTIVRAPGFNNWDMTINKHIPLKSEARFFEIRWEMYNVFNHTQFAGIDTTAQFDPAGNQVNGRFGQAIASRPPRIMQLGLLLTF